MHVLLQATLPLPFTSSAAMMALPPADNSAAANPHAILQAQQAMQLMAMQGAWYQAIQIQALQQQAIVALQVASQGSLTFVCAYNHQFLLIYPACFCSSRPSRAAQSQASQAGSRPLTQLRCGQHSYRPSVVCRC
jgi:lysophospholipid acyltransferase (LPLAT)-like uncharacterized protein